MEKEAEEEYFEVRPSILQVCGEEFLMMSYELDGCACITFAQMGNDFIYVPAVFPPDLVQSEELLRGLADWFDDQGYKLVYEPEQLTIAS